MLDAIISWILAIHVAGLPIFASDRCDVYLQRTNDVPYTAQFLGEVDADADAFPAFEDVSLLSFIGPGVSLSIFPYPDPATGSIASLTVYALPDVTTTTAIGAYAPLFNPVWFTEHGPFVAGPSYQLEWIEASLQRHLQHGVVGLTVTMVFDVVVSCVWGIVVAFTRVVF